jgi:hypothetical protein
MLNRKPAALTRDGFPDSQPRRDRKVRRGLLGLLDDLRTRVKPTRGVLGNVFVASVSEGALQPGQAWNYNPKRGLQANAGTRRDAETRAAGTAPPIARGPETGANRGFGRRIFNALAGKISPLEMDSGEATLEVMRR